jgi:hypothetical protein
LAVPTAGEGFSRPASPSDRNSAHVCQFVSQWEGTLIYQAFVNFHEFLLVQFLLRCFQDMLVCLNPSWLAQDGG